MRTKLVMRYDPGSRMFRVGRVMWECGTVGDGRGYSGKLSLGLRPRLWDWHREFDGWILTILGVRIHWRKSYGGRFA